MAKHTHSQLDAPNVMDFEQEFDDKSEFLEICTHLCCKIVASVSAVRDSVWPKYA